MIFGLPVPISNFGDIPVCYKVDPDNPKNLLPIQERLELMYKALQYSKSCSSRECCEWLAKQGITISHWGFQLFKRNIPLSKDIHLPLEERMKKYG